MRGKEPINPPLNLPSPPALTFFISPRRKSSLLRSGYRKALRHRHDAFALLPSGKLLAERGGGVVSLFRVDYHRWGRNDADESRQGEALVFPWGGGLGLSGTWMCSLPGLLPLKPESSSCIDRPCEWAVQPAVRPNFKRMAGRPTFAAGFAAPGKLCGIKAASPAPHRY